MRFPNRSSAAVRMSVDCRGVLCALCDMCLVLFYLFVLFVLCHVPSHSLSGSSEYECGRVFLRGSSALLSSPARPVCLRGTPTLPCLAFTLSLDDEPSFSGHDPRLASDLFFSFVDSFHQAQVPSRRGKCSYNHISNSSRYMYLTLSYPFEDQTSDL